MTTVTKKTALEQLRTHFVRWLMDQRFPDMKNMIENLVRLPVEAAVVFTEQYLIPPFKQGLLTSYVELEIGRMRALLMTAGQPDRAKTPVTDEQKATLVKYIKKAIEIIQM